MADQFNENDGLHLQSQYTQPESSYSDPYQDMEPFYQEPYRSTYTVENTSTVSEVLTGSFMYMFIALLITGITAVITVTSPVLLSAIFSNSTTFMLLLVMEFGIVFAASAAMKRNNIVLSGILFFAYAVVNGLTLSVIFLAYAASTIERAFFATAIMFGVMAFIGKVTKKDLTSIGNILLIGLIAVILASLVNIMIGSTVMDLAITIIAIIIFLGLTAYDTQKIQKMAQANTGYSLAVISMWGAMELYLDFINLFLRILRLFGRRD